ncbi:hypothetical protein SDJN02_27476, partial [Cucurbita argyrosperma subsp. argyrosperma]
MCYFGFSIPISSAIRTTLFLFHSHNELHKRSLFLFSFLSHPLFCSDCTSSATHGHQAIYSLLSFSFHHVYCFLDSFHGFSSFFFDFLDLNFFTS